MKHLLRWFRGKKTEPREDINLDSIVPLIQMVEPAEPDADLLSRIERRIDDQIAAEPERSHNPVSTSMVLIAALVVGLIIGFLGEILLPSRQSIVAQTSATGPWIPLGSVTLHGSTLRSFVRAKCQGQTHFFITMHGFHSEKDNSEQANAPLLMENEEKIRMECIF